MIVQELKTDPLNFEHIDEGLKLAEIRVDDRNFAVGNYLLLRETEYTGHQMLYRNKPLVYTGYHILVLVTHIHSAEGLEGGWKAMSFKVLNKDTRRTHGD